MRCRRRPVAACRGTAGSGRHTMNSLHAASVQLSSRSASNPVLIRLASCLNARSGQRYVHLQNSSGPPMPPAVAPLSQEPLTKSDAQLVAQACGRAAQVLGLSKEELSAVVGKHRTTIDRTGLDPKTKEGELALLLLRLYRSLHALCGGDRDLMRHWMEQPNHHLSEQPPRLLLTRIEGLNRVANYLDALRG